MTTAVMSQTKMVLEDPSEYRPEFKSKDNFRDFNIHTTPERVINVYKNMHTFQTLDFVKGKIDKWCKFDHAQWTIMEALDALNGFVDQCDPDIDIPNSLHAYQTAEAIRKAHPENEWFQLTGLIHDIGKVMALWGEPQWSTVGDTYPVGCMPDNTIVFGVESFKDNPDMLNEKYTSKLGIYEENCGLDKLFMTWGHDEYLYRVLTSKKNTCKIPEEGLYMIRFHSFYPWHMDGAYDYFCSNKDREMMKWVNKFNQFDLYTKCPVPPKVDELKEYYQGLVDKYIPGKLHW